MSTPLRSRALLVLLLLALPSCGGAPRHGDTAEREGAVPSLRLLPPETPVVMHADMDGLRRSPYYEPVVDATRLLPERERRDVATLLRVLDRTDHFVIGFDPSDPEPEETLVVLRGAYAWGDLSVPEDAESEAYRQHTLRGRGYEWASLPRADTLLFGQRADVHGGLDRVDQLAATTGPSLPGFDDAAALAQLGERDVATVWVFTEGVRAELGTGRLEGVLRRSGVSAGVSLHLREGAQLRGFVRVSDAAALAPLEGALRELLELVAAQPAAHALGVSAILARVQMRAEDTTLRVELAASDAEVRELIESARRLLQSASDR